MVVRYLATNPAFVGVGVARASALWDAFGEDLYRVLGSGEVERLAPVLGEELAERLALAWGERLAEADVVTWMAEHGLAPQLALKAVRFWGEGALRRLRENPYVLVALADWQAVDRLASKMGFANDHPARLGAAVEAATYARLARQHTWTAHERLVGIVTRMLPGANAGDAVALAERDGAVVRVGEGYQPVGAHMMERFVADRLAAMLAQPATDDLLTGRSALGRALRMSSGRPAGTSPRSSGTRSGWP